MNRFVIYSALVFFICCFNQPIDNHTTERYKSGWVKPELEGHWKFVTAIKVKGTSFLSQYPDPKTPPQEVGPKEPPYIGPDLIFEKDTIYELYYPTSLVERNNFSLEQGYLQTHFKWHTDSYPVELVNDTL